MISASVVSPAGVEPAPAPAAGASPIFKITSVLLQYPSYALFDGINTLREVIAGIKPRSARELLDTFVDYLAHTPAEDVVKHYVRTFDMRRRCALYITYYRYGDTRNRGMAMIEFKNAYRTAGFTPDEEELPDYLPMVLDFASLTERGQRLLHGHRTDLELLRRALAEVESPYANIIAALLAALPKLGRRELKQVLSAWQSGPPTEEVGLEPFAPPEYMGGYGQSSPQHP